MVIPISKSRARSGKWNLHHMNEPLSPEDIVGVSIIKPLTGVDPNLKINLETFFTMKYPLYELLFSVENDNDPAILVVKSLIESYPNVDAKLFIGSRYVGPNGKINNMIKPYEASKHDIVLVSDSSIKMKENTLMQMMTCLKPDVGMVLQMPFCENRKGFASIYEKVYFGTMQARNCLSANLVGINCSTGMSCLMRKDILDQAGGMATFGKYLAEDYFFAEVFRKNNYRVVLCALPALQNSGSANIKDFNQRLVRWCKLRFAMLPHLMFLEPISECIIMGVCAALAFQYLFDFSPLAFFLLHVLVWFLLDYLLISMCEGGPFHITKFEFLAAWLLREFLVFYVFFQSQKSSLITWRNKHYRLQWGGLVEEVYREHSAV
ncbi:ceramide glucosyltransferase-like isoform X2 [Gigantopelta aegis]|uniref:ceramide glucosyltransferase-like isoform X2 n=1 Tax=Gigantopelta aegis TaxID=1735272 RepID=UPI001B88906A|nr:ceramide glucosyltransferase-like isoform X2 [Gigantopelta aegis]